MMTALVQDEPKLATRPHQAFPSDIEDKQGTLRAELAQLKQTAPLLP